MKAKDSSKQDKEDAIKPKDATKQTPDAIKNTINTDKRLTKKEFIVKPKLSKLARNDVKLMSNLAAINNKKLNIAKDIVNKVDDGVPESDIIKDLDKIKDIISKASDSTYVEELPDIEELDIPTNNVSAARMERMETLDREVENKEIKGKTIKEIVEAEDIPTPVTNINIATPDENWKTLKYINFDKNYNIDKDILNCFMHLSKCSQKLSIVDISVENTSTSEDRIETYTVK